jgi:hypothetical protein
MGIETDTNKAKYGDGFAAWQDLPYFVQPQVGAIVPDGTADGQTLRWEADTSTWDASSALIVDDAGNVGIGTTAPDAKLEVNGSTLSPFKLDTGSNNNCRLIQTGNTGINFAWNAGLDAMRLQALNGSDAFQRTLFDVKHDGSQVQIYTNNTPRMTFDATGNVGIGTAAPLVSLDVTGAGAFRGANTSLRLQDPVGGDFRWQTLGSATTPSFRLVDDGAGAERMRIDSSGSMLVGVSTLGANNATSFQFNADTGVYISSNGNQIAEGVLEVNRGNGNGWVFGGWVSSVQSGGIYATNGVGLAFAAPSDARLKENIAPLTGQLDIINALKPSEFDMKASGTHVVGFVAQDVQSVIPEAVTEDETPEKMLSLLGMSAYDARLTAAIQELTARVAELEAK